ncbi:hypothetical protein HYH03_010872 [Edaphochlamys debaryana]|uniref:Cap-specific mRNA (nucleoside-2'-O-)-methyltransferase 1 n=1 Tax=Edaphochlamys debaryana TaxID=47281 RepID=A0A835Y470_9CHLO|nr:hypothetical protein HYH03_010872 [Edaphochlamys debaryana]|eukprot:KAG2490714.1 hypothetical protein HYH03_010872 [Edaphochlamys debaryana]
MYGGGGMGPVGPGAFGPIPMPMGPVPGAMPMPAPMAPGPGGVLRSTGVQGQGRIQAVQATRRKTAAGQEQRHEMRERMRYIMYEIDESNDHFIAGRQPNQPFQFLDVCCCPGGFSTYSLTAGPAPRKGIGLSLPPELGGHLPAIELETDQYYLHFVDVTTTDQYYLHFVDVTTVAAGVRVGNMGVGAPGCPRPALTTTAGLDDPPTPSCQLVILDGSFLGGKDWIHKETSLPDAENPAFNVYGTNAAAHKALLVAQLIVMANTLAPGGTLVLRLNMFPDMFTIGVLGLLRQVFRGEVCSYKPRSCHVHVGSYYLVCRAFEPAIAVHMQWVPRWHGLLQSLRSKGPAPRFVPFPGFHLDSPAAMQTVWTRAMYTYHTVWTRAMYTYHTVWTRAMYTYHVHLWRFLKLVEVAMEDKAMLDRRLPNRPRAGRFTNSCGRIFAGVPCSGRCNSAHSFEELHPFVQKAFREPRGFLLPPGSVELLSFPLAPYDPLPEALLELRQQAHVQAVMHAQAAAAQQQAAMAAAAAAARGGGGGAHLMSHVGSYDDAVQLGMAGEWVAGLMRDPRDTAEAGEDALRLFMRPDLDDPNVIIEGGFDEDKPSGPVAHPGPGGPGVGPGAAAAARPDSAGGAATVSGDQGQGAARIPNPNPEPEEMDLDDWEAVPAAEAAQRAAKDAVGAQPGTGTGTGARGTGGTGAAGGAGGVRPELLRMSGYQPRLGLVTVEVEDDDTVEAMLQYLGW